MFSAFSRALVALFHSSFRIMRKLTSIDTLFAVCSPFFFLSSFRCLQFLINWLIEGPDAITDLTHDALLHPAPQL